MRSFHHALGLIVQEIVEVPGLVLSVVVIAAVIDSGFGDGAVERIEAGFGGASELEDEAGV